MIIRSRAPLRLGLAGGGTDVPAYCDAYGGYVLNVTINMYAYCTIQPTYNEMVEFYSADLGEHISFPSRETLPEDTMLKLHAGTYNKIVKQYNNGKPLSLRITTYSDAPAGSGLGSSSTMVVAMLKAYMEWLNLPMGEYDMASTAYQIERVDLGLSGGKQDQYAATFGGLNFIEFLQDGKVIVNPLRIKKWIKNEIENSLLLYYTGTSRESAHIIDDQANNTRHGNLQSMKGMLELKEAALQMKEAVLTGNFDAIAENLNRGWEAKKKTSSVISNPSINEIYDYVLQHGARAAKISGAGGGGFMMLYCDPLKRHQLIHALQERGGMVVPVNFTESGTQAWTIYD